MSEAPKKRWYVVQAFSGFEGRVATSLREYIKLQNMEELFGRSHGTDRRSGRNPWRPASQERT